MFRHVLVLAAALQPTGSTGGVTSSTGDAAAAASPSPPSPLPETDWLSHAGHGVFTHFLNGLQNEGGRNSQGKNSSWNSCIAQFDVEAYATDAAATGAKYAFITVIR